MIFDSDWSTPRHVNNFFLSRDITFFFDKIVAYQNRNLMTGCLVLTNTYPRHVHMWAHADSDPLNSHVKRSFWKMYLPH